MKQSASVNKLSVILSWIIAVILAALPFHALFTTWIGSNTGHLDLIRIWKEIILALMLPFVVWLAMQQPKTKDWLRNSWLVRLIILYVLLHLMFGIWAYKHHQVNATALIYSLIINLRFVYFFVVCAIVASFSSLLIKNWAKIVLWPAVAVVFFGILQKFALPNDFLRHFGYGSKTIPAYQTVDSDINYRRIQSTMRGANPLGAYLVLVIIAAVALIRKNKFLISIILAASVVVLYFSYSRSAWIGLVISLAVLMWLMYPKKQLGKIMVVAVVALSVAGGALYLARSSHTVQDSLLHTSKISTSSVTSNGSHLSALKSGVKDVIHQPEGRGPGTAGPASFRNNHPRIAENYFLQIGQEVGVLGMTIFIAINVIVARRLWARRADVLAQVLLASLVGITFMNLVSHAWTDDTLSLLWWGLAGIALAPIATLRKNT